MGSLHHQVMRAETGNLPGVHLHASKNHSCKYLIAYTLTADLSHPGYLQDLRLAAEGGGHASIHMFSQYHHIASLWQCQA